MRGENEPRRPVASSHGSRPSDAERHRALRRQGQRRRTRTRRRVAGLGLVALIVLAAVLIGAPSGGHPPAGHSSSPKNGNRAIAASASRPRPARRFSQPVQSPGSLPQTSVYPSARTAQFKALMASLWAGVVRGSVEPALAAFFPKGAYLQLKDIAGAASDWTNRLVGDYSLDIGAAHALLGQNASTARLLRVDVEPSYGHWIGPGVCDNGVGYYEMPGARVVYRDAATTRSFGIASMISWRGVWYVVHLGAVLRPADTGVVDEAGPGPGTPAYSGTC
jgi:hypothetical protein